ncbi:hypothetical protein [uncultured Legionella sp.]|uniref:hypothetical protein n=1 Tax=uncultured Legionella sp. TaxID=210934 RepID=UPI00260F2416|nr:hypothetical protein [uncultured Legionella sp.]
MQDKKEDLSADANDQEKPFFLTKSYRPTKPPTFTEEEKERFAENAKNIRTDGHNLRFDERRQMYFYLPKDHPEYKEHPEDVEENNNWCTLL